MATHSILAEQTVSITELRKNPSQYFQAEPVAVLANNKPTGYLIGVELYEQMVLIMEQADRSSTAQFRPTKARLEAITRYGMELLEAMDEKDLGDFQE